MIDRITLAPFVLLEYEHALGPFCLMLSDGDMEEAEEVFQAWGAEGNGHGWEGLAESVVRSRMPEITELTFATDAGAFAALRGEHLGVMGVGVAPAQVGLYLMGEHGVVGVVGSGHGEAA